MEGGGDNPGWWLTSLGTGEAVPADRHHGETLLHFLPRPGERGVCPVTQDNWENLNKQGRSHTYVAPQLPSDALN